MNFTYRFPAVRGVQAGKEYYISMVPMKFLPKLFPVDIDVVLPEYRAQRKINEARIPEIKNYILNNRNTYVFSALSASIDGDFEFVSADNSNNEVGILEVDMESVFLINDGQHRKAAIEAAMNEDPSIGEETISVVFFKDDGLARSQQIAEQDVSIGSASSRHDAAGFVYDSAVDAVACIAGGSQGRGLVVDEADVWRDGSRRLFRQVTVEVQ